MANAPIKSEQKEPLLKAELCYILCILHKRIKTHIQRETHTHEPSKVYGISIVFRANTLLEMYNY